MPTFRTGTIYHEVTNSGRHLVGENRPYYKSRWVGEITVARKRYRFRSTSYASVCTWLADMVQKYPYVDRGTGRNMKKGQTSYH